MGDNCIKIKVPWFQKTSILFFYTACMNQIRNIWKSLETFFIVPLWVGFEHFIMTVLLIHLRISHSFTECTSLGHVLLKKGFFHTYLCKSMPTYERWNRCCTSFFRPPPWNLILRRDPKLKSMSFIRTTLPFYADAPFSEIKPLGVT